MLVGRRGSISKRAVATSGSLPALAGTDGTNAGSASALSVPAPSGITEGDWVLIRIAINGSRAINTINSAGVSQIGSAFNLNPSSDYPKVYWYQYQAPASPQTNFSFTQDASAPWTGRAMRITGAKATNPFVLGTPNGVLGGVNPIIITNELTGMPANSLVIFDAVCNHTQGNPGLNGLHTWSDGWTEWGESTIDTGTRDFTEGVAYKGFSSGGSSGYPQVTRVPNPAISVLALIRVDAP